MTGERIRKKNIINGKNKNHKGELIVMSENLSQMVKNGTTEDPVVFSEKDLNVPPEIEPIKTEAPVDPSLIEISCLSDWFAENVGNFPNIRKPTIAITNVDPAEQLLITIPIGGTEGGEEKRRMIVFNDAHLLPVLNKPAIDMQVYNNGFRIVYHIGPSIFVKSYGVRTGLISVFCNDIDDVLVPYGIVRAKKKDENISIIERDPSEVRHKLNEAIDIEALQLRYKQSSKAEGLVSNNDAVKWLLERQATIEDINHHLQIDNVIIDTLI